MNQLKILFWLIAVLFMGIFIYRTYFVTPSKQQEKILDPSKKGVQSLLTRAEEKIPKEVSVQLDALLAPISEESYQSLKERSLFVRYELIQKAKLPKQEQKQEQTSAPREEEVQPVFIYKGTVQLGVKQAVILQEEGGRSFFVGVGDTVSIKSGEIEYELIDMTKDEVILLRSKPLKPQERITIPRK